MTIAQQAADASVALPGNDTVAGPRFVIGRGRRGGWIVNDRLGLVGGIFINEAAARHFASEESGRHPELVTVTDGAVFELEFSKVG